VTLSSVESAVQNGITYCYATGCGNSHITLNTDDEGRLCHCSIHLGKAGTCAACHTSALARMIGLALRAGVEPEEIAANLRGMACDHPAGFGPKRVLSCVDAVGQAIETGAA